MAKKRYRLLVTMCWTKQMEFETEEDLTGDPTPRQKLLVHDAASRMAPAPYGEPDNVRVVVGTEESPVLFTVDKSYAEMIRDAVAVDK
jgi:hypothetical protein